MQRALDAALGRRRVGARGAGRSTTSACSSCATRSRSPSRKTCRRSSSRCITSARSARSEAGASSARVDHASPYFGHMRLEEPDPASERAGRSQGKAPTRRRDVLIGARSYVDSAAGIRIVDWRHAPVSRIYYRYGEGDDYEEELGDRVVEGVVVARRGREHRRRRGRARLGPAGHVRARQGRAVAPRERAPRARSRPRRSGRRGRASRATSRLGVGADGQLRGDKHLPAIAAMLDEQQFDLIAQRQRGARRDPGQRGERQDDGRAAPRRATSRSREPQRFRPEKMFVVVPERGARPLRGPRAAVARASRGCR